MKYVCQKCGAFVDEEALRSEYDSPDGRPPYQEYGICPYCGCDDLADAEQCEICGEWIEESNMIGDLLICDRCRKVLTEDVLYILAKIQVDLDTDEEKARELLENYYV